LQVLDAALCCAVVERKYEAPPRRDEFGSRGKSMRGGEGREGGKAVLEAMGARQGRIEEEEV
jgi:hypothetical protein